MLKVWLFGRIRFTVDEGPAVAPKGAAAQRLLAYLALQGGREVAKDHAGTQIWGAGMVGDNFRRALSDLRKSFAEAGTDPDRFVRATGGTAGHVGTVGLDPDAWVDALEFTRKWEDAPAQALELANGRLLGALRDPGPWLTVRRQHYDRRIAELARGLAEVHWTRGDHASAIELARRAHEASEDYEPALLTLIELLTRGGNAAAAVDVAESFLRGGAENAERLSETVALLERVKSGALSRDDGPSETDEPSPTANRDEPPERLRSRQHAGLFRLTAAVLGGAALIAMATSLGAGNGDQENPRAGMTIPACDTSGLTEPSPADQAAVDAELDRGDPRTVREIVTRSRPRAIAVGGDGVWLAQSTDGSIWRLDPALLRPVGEPVPVGGTPFSLEIAEDAIWVTRDDGVLVRVDRDDGTIVSEIKYGPGGGEVALGGGAVWVSIYDGVRAGSLARIDPCSEEVRYLAVGEVANTVLFAHGALWVSDSQARVLHRVDPVTEEISEIALDVTDPQDIGAGGGFIWIAHYGPKRLTRVDPRTLERVGRPIEIGPGAAGVAVGENAVWIPNYEGDSLTRVDLTGLNSDPAAARVGNSPTDIALGFGRVWVPNNDSEPPTVTVVPSTR